MEEKHFPILWITCVCHALMNKPWKKRRHGQRSYPKDLIFVNLYKTLSDVAKNNWYLSRKGDPLLLYIHLTWWQFLPRTKCHTHRFAVRRDGMRKFKNIKTWNCDYCLHLQPNEIFLFFKATFKKSRSIYMFSSISNVLSCKRAWL